MTSVEIKKFFKTHIQQYKIGKNKIDPIPINKGYVHKKLDKNIVITFPQSLAEGKQKFRTRIVVANNNDFFFDHDLRHIPGMLIIEAVRQYCIAVSHAHFCIPMGDRFLINEINNRFIRLANKQDPTYLDLIINKAMIRNNIIHYMKAACYIHQNNKLIAVSTGTWSTVTKEVFIRLEEDVSRDRFPTGVMINAVSQP